jgi:hypothetical protein
MKNSLLICGLLLLSLCAGSVCAESVLSDENQTNLTYEDMMTLPNGTTVNVVVFMPITIIMDSHRGFDPLYVRDAMNMSDTDGIMMGNRSLPEFAFKDGFNKSHEIKNQSGTHNLTNLKTHLNSTVQSSVPVNQTSAMVKPNLSVTA